MILSSSELDVTAYAPRRFLDCFFFLSFDFFRDDLRSFFLRPVPHPPRALLRLSSPWPMPSR